MVGVFIHCHTEHTVVPFCMYFFVLLIHLV